MREALFVAVIALAFYLFVSADAREGFEWNEEVLLSDGTVLKTRRLSEFQSGPLTYTHIFFERDGKKYFWESRTTSPQLLEFNKEGNPVIASNIMYERGRRERDYPCDDGVVEVYSQGVWNQIPSNQLDVPRRANLASSMREQNLTKAVAKADVSMGENPHSPKVFHVEEDPEKASLDCVTRRPFEGCCKSDKSWTPDHVVVSRKKRQITLYREGRLIITIPAALSGWGDASKQIPAGLYRVDYKELRNSYYRYIHISPIDGNSYNDPDGYAIHGQILRLGWLESIAQRFDWTNGSIAVRNRDAQALWIVIGVGTKVEIVP